MPDENLTNMSEAKLAKLAREEMSRKRIGESRDIRNRVKIETEIEDTEYQLRKQEEQDEIKLNQYISQKSNRHMYEPSVENSNYENSLERTNELLRAINLKLWVIVFVFVFLPLVWAIFF